jgi:hypothetical protein
MFVNIPTPLFDRFVCHNNTVAAQVAGEVEDLESIGALPTLDGTIAWSFRGPSDTFDPEALFTFVIWRASLRLPLSRLLQDPRCESPVVILYRGAELPPLMLGCRKTSRLHFVGSPRDVLLTMISPLIVPVAFDGMIGVDHADMKLAIEHGGDMRHFECRSQNFRHATDAMIREVHDHLTSLGANAAVCVGLQVPSALTMEEFDGYTKKINDTAHPDTFAVISWVTHDDPETIASILTISG